MRFGICAHTENRATVSQSILISVDALRVGMYIQLEGGWINHPFPMSSFRISSPKQIHVLRKIGLKTVRYLPAKSLVTTSALDRFARSSPAPLEYIVDKASTIAQPSEAADEDLIRQYLATQERCQKRFVDSAGAYCAIAVDVREAPQQARMQAEALIDVCVNDLLTQGPCAVHLLAGAVDRHSAAHVVNVMVLALLLGQALGLKAPELHGLGISALLHDLGKVELPEHIAEPGAMLSPDDMQRYREHVGLSVALGQRMGLPSDVLIAIAQHHEMADGSGFPLHLIADDMSLWGQILALVNRYDRLCNPLHGEPAMTPHEAVASLYALRRECFDVAVLAAFVRMMGVYPPGTLVQLVDDSFALVVNADPSHPLRPNVISYRADSAHGEVQLLRLAHRPDLGILRSVKPAQLPREVLDHLLPQPRICYYFERAQDSVERGRRRE